ncbi:prepronociceptin-like [Sinocyclocheilus anshuiensis]|uniref:Prepronociceptin-like n=1 Tax=Sinocyclocheilus anshuiensis TaxID=1608454 RepID=A0A671PU22_9TELE|nr:PREDICTED: prepronociceptin-like [Sinocyclocheilus anshuiensis]
MKTPFWTLLLLYLCTPGHSNCQGDCLTCGLVLPEHQAFNTLVCILECESQATPALTWDLCYQAAGLKHLSPLLQEEETSKRSDDDEEEPLATVSIENDNGVEYTEALEQFRHAAQALRSQQPSEEEKLEISYDRDLDPRTEEDQDSVGEEKSGEAAVSISKRFGGFMKGRHGFRKLVSSGRPLQKRYGGFIGIRKSARKWNNQKRVSQLLRQYLSLTGRSGRSGHTSNLSTRI